MTALSLPVIESTDKLLGTILYRGPSYFNGDPIVVIATGFKLKSGNSKTGDMIQVWILPAEMSPIDAANSGADEATCSSCKHRHFRSCYVNLANGPHQVYRAYKMGKYREVPIYKHSTAELFRDRNIRLGAYGDPAAVPIEVWESITKVCAGWTGYTHQWKRCNPKLKNYCMASCDTLDEAKDAMRRGWKPFFVRQADEPLPPGFFTCPASKEAGKRLTCSECRACRGGEYTPGKGVPSIIVHGPSWKIAYYKRGMRLRQLKEKIVGVFRKKSAVLMPRSPFSQKPK